jgi:hypothetical protein
MKQLLTALSITLCIFLQCGCSTPPIEYKPIITNDVSQSKKDIEFTLYSQLKNKTPNSVRITEDFIGIGGIGFKRSHHIMNANFTSTVGYANETRIYFRSLGKSNLYHRRSYYPVFVYDSSGYIIYQAFFKTKDNAKLFINSLYTLSDFYNK